MFLPADITTLQGLESGLWSDMWSGELSDKLEETRGDCHSRLWRTEAEAVTGDGGS